MISLKDAIAQCFQEGQAEYAKHSKDPALRAAIQDRIREEIATINEVDLFGEITGHAPILPEESQTLITGWVHFAFRFGMRVQRKMYLPSVPASTLWTHIDFEAMGRCLRDALELVESASQGTPVSDERWQEWCFRAGECISIERPGAAPQ